MDEKLIQRLESAVSRLESLSVGYRTAETGGGDAAAVDPSVIAFDDFVAQYLGRVLSAATKIGGQVEEVTKILGQAFAVQKELIVKIKQTEVDLCLLIVSCHSFLYILLCLKVFIHFVCVCVCV